ncbi:hypothetical protein TSUD_410420 [Trifolium subterraneum]|uniref:CCHC-type domain-containing protein n=1 Tax=Trifolium subterraneum TaxID=3900 RepID=A0A2Z6P4I3_TRISU|nr:hypothetical protein TSUD_410420 [Trifolium subterraneum]
MCEAFNSAILEYRDKPIISLVEGLKFYMTNRIVKLRDYMLRKTTFLDTYSNIICPSDGPKGWPIVDATPIAPPYVRRAPGRPKKLRRKANDESRGSARRKRNQHTITCTRCKTLGHNRRSCKGKTVADRMIPKGGNKSNSNMNQPGPSATTTWHAPTATNKGPVATAIKESAATGPSGLRRSHMKKKNDNTAPNVITPNATTIPSGQRKSARFDTNVADPVGTQQSVNKP